jgi:hypothetical protein
VFLIDDLALRALGITLPSLDLFWTIEQIYKFAYKEMYNPDKIKSQIKENRLLYEFGEVSRDDYERTNSELMHKLKLAELALEMDLGQRTDLLGSI